LLALVLIVLLGLGSAAPLAVEAQGTPSITITTPVPAGDVVPDGDDFATTVLGNPWDMTESFPAPSGTTQLPPDVESTVNVDNVSISGGIFHGVARTAVPQLILLTRGYGQSNPCCLGSLHWKTNDGFVNPLDAGKYHTVSIRMRITGASQSSRAQFFLYRTDNPNENPEIPAPFATPDGWQTYTVDLKTSGTVHGVLFVPTTTPGATVDIDWVRFLPDPTSTTAHTVRWQTANAPAGAQVDLSCTDPNGVACVIGQNLPAEQGAQPWNTALLASGTYTIVAQLKINPPVSSTATLTVNTTPQVQITAPSRSSGPDFATTVLGDPWDFSNPQDVQKVEFSSFQIANGILSGVSIQSNGPDFELSGGGRRIDTAKYHYVTFKYRMDDSMQTPAQRARDQALKIAEGWAARFIWWGPGGPAVDECTSDWVPVEPYELVYSFDLATTPVEMGAGVCGPQGKPWSQANVTQFRFDPHEVPQPTGWAIDYIKLTGNQEASGSLAITWNAQDPDTGQTVLVDLFYSASNTGANPTSIKTDIPATAGSYTWDTSGLTPGTYFIIARIRDGLNTVQRISEAPFNALQAPASCSPRPNISVQSAASGDGRLRVTVTASSASNPLQSIRFDQANGALIDVPGQQTGSTGSFSPALPAGTTSFTFFLRRATAGQPATAPFTITDSCGDWRSFAGGGTAAPF